MRTFDGTPLSAEDRRLLQEYAKTATNPFGGPVEFRFLEAGPNRLSRPVLIGENLNAAAKVPHVPNFEAALGDSFEEVCIYARQLGIGTVILAATLSRKTFEPGMEVKDGEVMPVVSPFGYAAAKPSMRERLTRPNIRADFRKDFSDMFF